MKKCSQNERASYLLKNTLVFTLGNVGTKLISFVLVPVYTYVLSTEEYGTIDLISAVITVILPIVTLNISEAIMRFALDSDADYNKIMSTGIVLAVSATGIIVLLSATVEGTWEVGVDLLCVCVYSVSLVIEQMLMSYLRGKELLLKYSIGNIIHTFFAAVLNIVFLVWCKWGVEGYFLAYALANVITSIYVAITGNIAETITNFSFDIELTKKMIKYSTVLIPTSFMWWIMNSSDRIMVSHMIGMEANGIYTVSYKIPTMVSTLSTIFSHAWSYSAIREEESPDREDYNNQIYDGLVAVVLTAALVLLMILKPFMRIYVAEEYYTAWRYTPQLIVGVVFMTLGSFLATPYTVHKDTVGFLKSGIIGAIVNVVLNSLLIPVIGVCGAAVATCFSYAAVFLFRANDTRKYLRIRLGEKRHIVGYVILIGAACTVFLEGISGQILLGIECICVVYLFRARWKQIILGLKENG